jgi:hypothetical protein
MATHTARWLLLALVLTTGCADNALMMEDATGSDIELRERGQTVLFVGTDPINLETDLFLAKALAEEGEDPPTLLEAGGFEVEALSVSTRGVAAGLFPDGSDLFSGSLPYAVPDRDGTHVGLVATTQATDTDLPSGRAGLLDLSTLQLVASGDIEGLAGLSFSANGSFVFLTIEDIDGQPVSFVVHAAADFDDEPLTAMDFAGLPDGAQVQLASSIRESDDFLVLVRPEGGNAGVWRLSPTDRTATALAAPEDANVTSPVLSPSGIYLAATVSGASNTVRSLDIFDLDLGTQETVSDPAAADCSWPVWAPAVALVDRLAYVCQSLATDRPDIALWPADETTSEAGYLTDRLQPAIVGGSMDGQVVRSRPHWDPLGEFLVFGASSADELDGDLTLLVLPLGAAVYPIYQAPQGSVGWAHFSALAGSGELLVWDRGTTGLQSSRGSHPIRVVPTDAPNPTPRDVDLGQDMLVSYPLFLGQNTMLYP